MQIIQSNRDFGTGEYYSLFRVPTYEYYKTIQIQNDDYDQSIINVYNNPELDETTITPTNGDTNSAFGGFENGSSNDLMTLQGFCDSINPGSTYIESTQQPVGNGNTLTFFSTNFGDWQQGLTSSQFTGYRYDSITCESYQNMSGEVLTLHVPNNKQIFQQVYDLKIISISMLIVLTARFFYTILLPYAKRITTRYDI